MRYFVVPDLHGRMSLASGLLFEAGLIDERGVRVSRDDVRVVQLGDLANCCAGDRDRDLALLRKARAWFDVILVGNHEHPYFGGPRFNGFFPLNEVEQAIRNLSWRPAYAVGGTLLTHAGVTPGWFKGFGGNDLGAADAEAILNAAWKANPARSPFFATISYARGGYAKNGGVIWSDWNRERRDYRFSQVHGHTPVASGPKKRQSPKRGTFAINLDVGGHGPVSRIVGLWLDEDGKPDGFVEYAEAATG